MAKPRFAWPGRVGTAAASFRRRFFGGVADRSSVYRSHGAATGGEAVRLSPASRSRPLGIAIGGWGMLTFARAHTAIAPIRPASQLVQHGPYRFTRNPMYSGLTVEYLGVAGLFNSRVAALMLPVVVVARQAPGDRSRGGVPTDANSARSTTTIDDACVEWI